MKYSQTLIDDEYESSNIASQKEVFWGVHVCVRAFACSYTYVLQSNVYNIYYSYK